MRSRGVNARIFPFYDLKDYGSGESSDGIGMKGGCSS